MFKITFSPLGTIATQNSQKNDQISIFFFYYFSFITSNANSNIKDKIVAKIGNEIITNYDVINEINTILAISEVADERVL